jgi:hypothetical protein
VVALLIYLLVFMSVLLLAMLLGLSAFVLVLMGSDGCGGEPVVMMGNRGARQPADKQRARQQEYAEIAKSVEEGCHQVTLPYQR